MPSNPITPQEQYDILINRSLTPRDGVTTDTYMAAGYILMPPATVDGPVKWRLFDAAYVQTGIIDPNRLGTGATGAGNLYLADDGTWKVISGAPGIGDMLKATYDVDNDGTVDSAERIEIIVRNSTGTTLTKGTVVYLSGATGNRPNAVRAQADTEATSSKTIGIVVANIANNSDGYVACNGTLHDLDTSAFADGAALWLSATTAGAYTSTIPAEPNHTVFIGYVARSHPTLGRLVILIQNGYELNELHGVLISAEANNDLLVYESSSTLWKNKTISAIFGGTPLVSVPTLAQVTTAGNTTTNAITVGNLNVNGQIVTRGATLPAWAANGSVVVGSTNVTGSLGVLLGVQIPYVSGAFGGHFIGYSNQTNPKWLIAISRNVAQENSLVYYEDSTAASPRFAIHPGGNVTIGTITDAGYKLDVAGTINGQGIYSRGANIGFETQIAALGTSGSYRAGYYLGSTNTTYVGRLGMSVSTGDMYISLGNTTSLTDVMYFKSSGNVGIGTTNPTYRLDVQGNTRVAGSVEVGANTAVQGGLSLYQQYTSSTNFIGSISTEYGSGAMILGYGAVGKSGVAGYVSSFDNFTGFRSAIKIGQNTPLIVLGTSSAVATTVGSDITMSTLFQITNAGNVGIGSGNPSQKLDVVGSAKVRGATFFGAISQPSPPTLITNSTTGGTLAAATYYYRIVSVDFFGNTTTPSNELAVTTAGSTSSITLSWPLVQGAYQYRIYRGTTSGGQNTYYTLSGTNSTSFTDTGAAGTAGTTPAENLTSYGYYNSNGDFRSGNILIVNNGVGNISSINFDKSTDGPAIKVVEYQNDSTMFEFSLADNPDGTNDFFNWVMPDWQNPSSGWKPLKFSNFVTQIVGQSSNFWSSFSLPSSTPYYTTNPESVANSSIKWDPYTSTSYNLLRDNGTGTGNLNVDVTGFTGTTNTIYWVTIASPTTFNWGLGWSGGTASGTGVTITGGWQVLGNGIQIRLTGTFVTNDRWAFRAFPVPRMGIGTTTPTAPLQVSTTIAAVSGIARGVFFNPTVVATANSDTLVGLDINPTFTNGAFTGVKNYALRLGGNLEFTNQNFIISSAGGITRLNYNGGVGYSLVTDNTSTPFRFIHNTSNEVMRIFGATGNLLLQNGGTFTDAGYRLDVNGTARVQGSITATLANTVTSGVVYYNSSTGLLTYGALPAPTAFQIDYDYNIVGIKNGVNVVFTTSANFVLTTTRVFLNGQRLTRGVGYDYVETGTNQVTFVNPLNPTDQIIIEYQI